ncbi:MAG: hypothetical protein JWP95_1000 [Actinotalea sp.]|nr:hypothetical protein [Actinotalea sp.]
MSRSKTTTWVAGSVVLALLMMAAAWLLAISPKLEAAAELRFEAEAAQSQADQLQITLAGLKNDFANIEEFRNELSVLQVQLPREAELSNLTRQINGLATQSQVLLSAVAPGTPTAVAPPGGVDPLAQPVAPAEGEPQAATDETGAVVPPPVDPAVLAVQGLYSIPLQVTVVGGYGQTLDFLNRLQVENPRLLLVSSFVATAQEAKGAEGGRPATNAGDLEMIITAYAYVLIDPAAATAPVVDDGTVVAPAPLPVPAGDTNPFATNT